jgi:nucleotidyltransferase/DNA polymerase involved in DNA repair|tara:strand:+ start:932 stop:1690 length:759 start_codon:yes stop_codon:yes gene_type:complete
MSTLEIIIALFGGIIAGTTFSILVSKYLKPEFPGSAIASKPTKSIPEIGKKFEVEQARLRYKTLKLEKELHTDALGRVFQAEGDGRITKKERDLLSDRYREQIRTLDNSLQDSELILEASELENLHEELTNLFSQKLNQVERRLNELTTKLETVKTFTKPDMPPVMNGIPEKTSKPKETTVEIPKKMKVPQKITNAPVTSIEDNDDEKQITGEKIKTNKDPKDTPSADDKVNEIRDEVLEALNRLEQMDVEE